MLANDAALPEATLDLVVGHCVVELSTELGVR
jgi:hypothetical protein